MVLRLFARAQAATPLPAASKAIDGSVALSPISDIATGGPQGPPDARVELKITDGLRSLLDQRAIAAPAESIAKVGFHGLRLRPRCSTAGDQAPAGWRVAAWTTLDPPGSMRVQRAMASPVGPIATCGASASLLASGDVTGSDHAPNAGPAALRIRSFGPSVRVQTATASPVEPIAT